jgi:predicted secreted protein
MLQIDASQAGQTVQIAVGEAVELRLAENLTTGSRWTVLRDGAPACRITDAGSEPDGAVSQPPKPGQGSTHVWRIAGIQPGTCDVALAYARPWEAQSPPAAAFDVRFHVEG